MDTVFPSEKGKKHFEVAMVKPCVAFGHMLYGEKKN
jgi:hypothetical protein